MHYGSQDVFHTNDCANAMQLYTWLDVETHCRAIIYYRGTKARSFTEERNVLKNIGNRVGNSTVSFF